MIKAFPVELGSQTVNPVRLTRRCLAILFCEADREHILT